MQIWPRDTVIKRSSMSHMDDVIGMMAYLEKHTDGRVTQGRYVLQGSCNHLEQTMRDVCLSGSSRIFFRNMNSTYYELNLHVLANIIVDNVIPNV